MNELKQAYRMTALIGLWMIMAEALLIIPVEYSSARAQPVAAPQDIDAGMARYVLFAFCAVLFVVERIIRERMLAEKAPLLSEGRRSRFPAEIQRLIAASIATFALCEVVALFGLVLFFATHDRSDFYLFVMISLIFFSVKFPSYRRWEAWMGRLGRGR